MLFQKVGVTDELLTENPMSNVLHYFRDGRDIIFTYKDRSKRPKLNFRYIDGCVRVRSWDGGVVLCNPLEGMDRPDLTDRIVKFSDYDTQILFASNLKLKPKKGVGAEATITFDIDQTKYTVLSIIRTTNKIACAEDLEKLRQLQMDAEYVDEYKPSGGARSVTRFILPFGYSVDTAIKNIGKEV